MLLKYEGRLRDLHHPPQTGLMKVQPPSWRFSEVLGLLYRRGLMRRTAVPQSSAIVGDAACARSYPISLTAQMVTHAWLAMRVNALPPGVRPHTPSAGSGLPPVKGVKPPAVASKAKDWASAVALLETAAKLRPDWAKGHANLELGPNDGNPASQFRILSAGGEYFHITCRANKAVFDCAGAGQDSETPVLTWADDAAEVQHRHFRFIQH